MTAERIAQAKRKTGDRSVLYTWRNSVMNQCYHEPNDAGEQVELHIWHDTKRKRYMAALNLAWWQPRTDTGFSVTLRFPFEHPSVQVNSAPVARFSEKSFAQFESDTLATLATTDLLNGGTVADLLNKALSY